MNPILYLDFWTYGMRSNDYIMTTYPIFSVMDYWGGWLYGLDYVFNNNELFS